jgi:peptidyl-prolyl cis-trans isomerase SurA
MSFRVILVFAISVLVFYSCSTNPSNEVVAKFGDTQITLNEFENAYAKNVGSWEKASQDSLSDYKNFLDLYVKFKLKLRDAEVRGYPQDSSLMNELSDYQKQVGVSYLTERKIVEPGVKQLYERRKEELRVSHIMIRPDSSGEEAAKELAQSILDSIKNGANYDLMAKRYSADKFSAESGGDIYFVTAGLLPVEFEDAMYATPEGSVYPNVVHTRYGYHIIKVTKRQPRIPKIKASHILVTYFDENNKPDTAKAKATIDSVSAMLNAGGNFEELAAKYSKDTGTKDKGGDLGFFARRQMVKEFDEKAFSMKVGEISEPIQTNFGFHIIKLVDKMKYPSFADDEQELKDIFQKQRYQIAYKALVDSLRKKYNYKLNDDIVDLIVEKSDSARFGMEYKNLDAIKGKVLFSYDNKNVTADGFLKKANESGSYTSKPIFKKDEVMKAVDKISEDLLLEEEALNLPKEDPEFAALMDDYKNGIFIFKLQEDEVWDKVKYDSLAVYNYWEAHKDNYSLPDRISYSEIFTTKDSLIQKYYKMLQAGADFDSLAALYTERPGKKKDKGEYPMQDTDFSDFSKQANKIENVGEFSQPVSFSGGYSIFKLNDRQPARLKTFEEAKAEVSSTFQEMQSKKLEQEYLDSLDKRYKPVIYYEALNDAFKSH